MDNKFDRIEYEADPNRCQGGGMHGQCPYKASENNIYCPRHGGNKVTEKARRQLKRQYDFAQWQAKVEGFSDYDNIKSLRDEVGVMRMLLQNLMLICKTENDLLLYTSKISDVIDNIKSLVVAMHRLDTSLGVMLDKSAALNIAMTLVDIISEEVQDEALSDKIGKRFAQLIAMPQED